VSKKQIILFLLIVCLPLAMLAWLGSRIAHNERRMVRQQFDDLLRDKLRDVDGTAAKFFEDRERELLRLTDLESYDYDAIRRLARAEPLVRQLLVLNTDGSIVYPDPRQELNDAEREFLRRAEQVLIDKDLVRAGADDSDALAGSPTADAAPTHGWYAWYWGPGLNLIFWHRLESGQIVAVALPRGRWIADLVAELPQTPLPSSDATDPDSRIRLVDSNGAAVYQWGDFEPAEDARPAVEMPLSEPLASWRLQYFVPDEQFAAAGRSAYFGLLIGLIVAGIALAAMALLFYREYAREMREAVQRVDFVNQVSHELKTPLTSIRMYADLLQIDLEGLDADDAAKPQERAKVIVGESERLSRLIGNVLTFARQQRGKLTLRPTIGVPNEAIAAVIERFTPAMEQKGIEIDFDGAATTPVRFDVDALQKILGNLLSNVEKYAPDSETVEIASRQEDGRTIVTVADHGPGIKTGHREKVFDPFYRISDNIKGVVGTGIGLSIARELARLHGGDLTLVPSHSGACFQVELQTEEVES